MENEELYRLPIYQIFYKETLLGGIPFNMAVFIFAGICLGLFVFNNFIISGVFVVLHIVIFILFKTSKKFDTKILEIIINKSWKKYINY